MKQKKIKLYAIGNEGDFNYYIFDKKNQIYDSLNKITNKIFAFYLDEHYENPDKTNIEKYKDIHEGAPIEVGRNSRLDIFYGDRKMFIAIICSKKLRLKFNEELFKIAEMPKLSKLKIKKHKK